MRVIVTEKGQDLRKELFFEKLNTQNPMHIAEDNSVGQGGLSSRKKTNRGLSLGTERDLIPGANYYQEGDMLH